MGLQLGSLVRFKNNSCSRRRDERRSDGGLLQSGHSDGFGNGRGCAACEGCSRNKGGARNGGGQSDGRGLDGVGRDGADEPARADGDSVPRKEFPQALDGPAETFLHRVVARAEDLTDFAQGFVLEITEQNGSSVGLIECMHGLIQNCFDVCPIVRGSIHGGEFAGDLFADLAAGFPADDVDGGATGHLIKPRSQNGIWR